MSDITLENIADFITRYREGIQSQADRELDAFQQGFIRLKGSFATIRDAVMEEAKRTAPDYNVFTLLGLSRYEVRTHSAMLAHLLNPQASHGQDFLFLRIFLEHCAQKHEGFPLPSGPFERSHWQVLTEHPTSDGRLDIVIRCPELNYIIVIENKVDADERENQLSRYGKWLASLQREYPSQALVFLSIYGRKPSTAGELPVYRLSYRDDIPAWLENALPQIQAPNVLEVVRQYRSLVSSL
jgi:hypothetical protein